MASGKGAFWFPSLWILEKWRNGLLMAERRGKASTAAEVDNGLRTFRAVVAAGIEVDALRPTIREAFAPAQDHQLDGVRCGVISNWRGGKDCR